MTLWLLREFKHFKLHHKAISYPKHGLYRGQMFYYILSYVTRPLALVTQTQ